VLWLFEVRALVVGKVGIEWDWELSGELRYRALQNSKN
jgi:hypothetical protein